MKSCTDFEVDQDFGHFSATGTRLCCKSTHCCTRALNISRHLFIIQIHTKLLFQLDSTHCTIIALYYCCIADCNLQCSVIMTFHAFSIFINESCRLLIFKGLKVSFFLDISIYHFYKGPSPIIANPCKSLTHPITN